MLLQKKEGRLKVRSQTKRRMRLDGKLCCFLGESKMEFKKIWILYLTVEHIRRRKVGTALYSYMSRGGDLVQLYELLNEWMGLGLV